MITVTRTGAVRHAWKGAQAPCPRVLSSVESVRPILIAAAPATSGPVHVRKPRRSCPCSSVMPASTSPCPTLLHVANYAPDVQYTWWVMEQFWIELARVAREQGLRPLLTYPSSRIVLASIQRVGMETVIMTFPGKDIGEQLSSLAFLRCERVRAIYFADRAFRSRHYAAMCALAARRIIVHDHTPGDRPSAAGLRRRLKSVLNAISTTSTDAFRCVSPLVRTRAIESICIPAEKAIVAQTGIAPLREADRATEVPPRIDLSEDRSICITVCRAHTYKCMGFVIAVAEELVTRRRRREFLFLDYDDRPEMPSLRARRTCARPPCACTFCRTTLGHPGADSPQQIGAPSRHGRMFLTRHSQALICRPACASTRRPVRSAGHSPRSDGAGSSGWRCCNGGRAMHPPAGSTRRTTDHGRSGGTGGGNGVIIGTDDYEPISPNLPGFALSDHHQSTLSGRHLPDSCYAYRRTDHRPQPRWRLADFSRVFRFHPQKSADGTNLTHYRT